MSLYQECCKKFKIKLNDGSDNDELSDYQRPVEALFGNINDVHECALRLADVLDEGLSQKIKEEESLIQQQNTPTTSQVKIVG